MDKTAPTQPVEFLCKEAGCGLNVRYERRTQPGAFKIRKGVAEQTFTVYLTCENGHVHSYEVPASR